MKPPPRLLLNLYPPFRGAGIWVRRISPAWDAIDVDLKERWWNRNAVGTHYGGSLYSMCDPFYMLILMRQLGAGYLVWDKSARVRFIKPGRGTVRARFAVTPEQVEQVRVAADADGKAEIELGVDVVDDAGDVVAHVDKLLQVRRKGTAQAGTPSSVDEQGPSEG